MKLNTDAAFDSVHNIMGLGWVLRDDGGHFLAAKSIRIQGQYTIVEAEALCMREALSWLRDTGMDEVDVETDSQLYFNTLRSESFVSTFGFLTDDVKQVASMLNRVNFAYVKRSANRAVHALTREAVSMSGPEEWLDVPPNYLVPILDYDLMN
ncbi:PREDICTED: uncharacterized protein LOC109183388 [Ipomoea nil]|uniref:uncharacterized protein LOC109183388 n=1 Tax=Ipomoea nil TaxID=35883 RepID=UPI0009014100|nr:PREDICTED: uncharacterized protein LOC109183388 [Ipomoea nil]